MTDWGGESLRFSGGLFAPRYAQRAFQVRPESSPQLEIHELGTIGWTALTLRSKDALLASDAQGQSLYRYPAILRVSKQRFLLACCHGDLLPQALSALGMRDQVVQPKIDVQRIVSDLSEHPDVYSMGTVWARVDGFGQALRTVAFFGSDLAEAKLFRDSLSSIAPYRATLRDVRTHADVITIGSRGDVNFLFKGGDSPRQIDKVLSFLSSAGYLDWEHDST